MYKIFMIVGITVVALGWIAYGIYNLVMDRLEKKRPRRSERLQQANESMAEYAKRMAKFKRKRYDQQDD